MKNTEYVNLTYQQLRNLAAGDDIHPPDVFAQYHLGLRYETGRGVIQNVKEAILWYRLAADQGHADTQYNLCRRYANGQGVTKDEKEAMRWCRLAADQGHAIAQVDLGTMYADGNGVPKSYEEAIRWYRLAAEQKNDRGMDRLGLMYFHGLSVAQNYAEAIRLFKLAAEQNNSASQCSLGWAYEQGHGVPVDYEKAVYWNRRASNNGYLESFNNLGWLYENGLGVNRDIIEAARLYKIASDKGHKEAKNRLLHLSSRHSNSSLELSISAAGISSREGSPIKHFLEDAFAHFVGLESVRDELLRQASYIQVQKLRAERGLPAHATPSKHLVFIGNPGTGKTTIARIIASLYHQLGILQSEKVIETDRAGLVAAYIGQSALKTKQVVESALGGVLFIDEAYTLARGGENDFGKEAIDTLLKLMEDHRDEFAVIVAGYESEMDSFIKSNPGLASRFNRYIRFPDYTSDELLTIFTQMCQQHSYVLSDTIYLGLQVIFGREIKAQHNRFSNARYVRNLFERVIEVQSHRLITSGKAFLNVELQTIMPSDIERALGEALPSTHCSSDIYEVVMQRLNNLIGLDGVKEQVKRLADFVRIQHARSDAGIKVAEGFSQHLVFSGNPGTGKTTVARIIADLYFALGVLPSNRIVEVDRSGLVAGYIGQSAIKTREVIERAIGGVLFIDEAYALSPGGAHEHDFGREVIDTLLKAMEDYRDQFVVIVAGYSHEMTKFIDSNPGLRSRFGRYITFEDCQPENLVAIFSSLCASGEYELNAEALSYLSNSIEVIFHDGHSSGNGRFIRNLFERCVEVQSQRISGLLDTSSIDFKTLTLTDVTSAIKELMEVQ